MSVRLSVVCLTKTTIQVMLSPPMPAVWRGSCDKQLSITSSQILESGCFPIRSLTKSMHFFFFGEERTKAAHQ